jgi:hypothetical protein
MTRAWALACLLLAVGACRREAPRRLTRAAAVRELALCAFDGLGPEPSAPAVESAIRRALRKDRYAFAVRAGRCGTVLDAELRARDPAAAALGEAWDALLPRAQASAPDDIALERTVRHVGNAWRLTR